MVARRLLLFVIIILAQIAHAVATFWMLGCILIAPDSQRAWTLALGYDYLGSAATGGSLHETISSRAYRAMQAGQRWGCVLCRVLDWIQKDHCRKSAQP